MTLQLFPPKIAEFINEQWRSAAARRMFFLGQVMVKVAGMFQISPDEDVPPEAQGVAILLLEGMESGNAAEYARCDALAMALYHEWLACRELH